MDAFKREIKLKESINDDERLRGREKGDNRQIVRRSAACCEKVKQKNHKFVYLKIVSFQFLEKYLQAL